MILAVTGHRPQDCEDEETVRRKLRNNLDPIGTSVLICGMAAGVDLWAADEARLLGIEVWAAKPWTTHGPSRGDEELYATIIDYASKVVNVTESDTYPGPWCYHKRNEWMVDHATNVLTYWSGKQSGGTYACLNYAKKKEVPVRNVY
jgi:uncharacterized phage-like protein YoqJ